MKPLLPNKTKLLVLVFLALFLSAYSAPGNKPKKSQLIERKTEFRSLKGVCNCNKSKQLKHKTSKSSAKYRRFHERNHLPW